MKITRSINRYRVFRALANKRPALAEIYFNWALPKHLRAAAAGIALINMVGILGGFVGLYWMGIARDWTGDYRHGLLTMSVPMLIAAGIMGYLRARDLRQSVPANALA